MILRTACLSLFALLLLNSCANKALLYTRKGDSKYKKHEFVNAIEFYQKALHEGGEKGSLNFKIGESLRRSNKIHEMAPYYKKAMKTGYNMDSSMFYLAMGLKVNGEYLNAHNLFKRVSKSGNESLKKRAIHQSEALDLIEKILKDAPSFEVKNAAYINTPEAEYSPAFHDGPTDLYLIKTPGKNA